MDWARGFVSESIIESSLAGDENRKRAGGELVALELSCGPDTTRFRWGNRSREMLNRRRPDVGRARRTVVRVRNRATFGPRVRV